MRGNTLLVGAIVVAIGVSACGIQNAGSSRHTLTVGSATGIPQLNPIVACCAFEETMNTILWDGLDKENPDGSPGPDLATSWTPSSDLKTWTFHLRQGVKFNNGRELTADDVVKSINYTMDPSTKAGAAPYNKLISDVKAVDKSTVEIDTKAADSALPLTIMLFQIIDVSQLSTINSKPNGTGPYMVKDFVPNDHVDLVPNPNYWGPKPKLDQLTIVKTADTTAAVADLAANDIQVFWGPNLTDIGGLASRHDVRIINALAPSHLHVYTIDDSSFPFSDVRARQALSYAMDRTTIVKVAYAGIGLPSPANDFLPTTHPAYDQSLPTYDFNLDKAKQLFSAVGVTSLTWWAPASGYPEWITEGQILQADLAKIGIKMDIVTNEISTWVAKFYPAHKKFPGLVIPNSLSGGIPSVAFNFLFGGVSDLNWQSADYDTTYSSALATDDSSALMAAWAKLQQIMNSEVPVLVPLQSTIPVPVRSTVTGVWVSNSGTVHLETAGNG